MSKAAKRAGRLWSWREEAEEMVMEAADLLPPRPAPTTGQKKLVAAVYGSFNRGRPRPHGELDPIDIVRSGSAVVKAKRIAAIGCVCENCRISMPSKRLVQLHHVVFVSRGGTNEDENTLLLCPNCHVRAHWLDQYLPPDERPRNRDELIEMFRKDPSVLHG